MYKDLFSALYIIQAPQCIVRKRLHELAPSCNLRQWQMRPKSRRVAMHGSAWRAACTHCGDATAASAMIRHVAVLSSGRNDAIVGRRQGGWATLSPPPPPPPPFRHNLNFGILELVSEAGNSFPCLSYVRELACYLREVTYAGHQAGVVFHAHVGSLISWNRCRLPKIQ